MLKLPDVTLVMIETREHELASLAISDCMKKVDFSEVIVFTNKREKFSKDFHIVDVEDWPNKEGWSRCHWYDVAQKVRTSHSLGIQWDSWIVASEMWKDDFLSYDYIGAPWWHKDGLNVGNGGFNLRSTALLRYIRKYRDKFPCITAVDDDLYCRKYRPRLQDEGFKWAPEPLAYNFSFECVRPDQSARHFGFHATFNFDYGCEGDEERLLERARLMSQSSYISEGRFWKGFAEKCPGVVNKLKETKDG